MLVLRLARVMIFSGPSEPKCMADALVASEKVGDGGAKDTSLRIAGEDEIASERTERLERNRFMIRYEEEWPITQRKNEAQKPEIMLRR